MSEERPFQPLRAAERVIVALDVDARSALGLADLLGDRARWLKVGMTLFCAAGPAVVKELRLRGFDVFADLKLHDIPHQVEGAARALAELGAGMITVHASGGREMIGAALRGAEAGAAERGGPRPRVLGVTVLTSLDRAALDETGVPSMPAEQVTRLARLATESGADGVVCSPLEVAAVRQAVGPESLLITPGVRPRGGDRGDQVRVATPAAAIAGGASHVVVGRPVTGAVDPVEAFDAVVEEVCG